MPEIELAARFRYPGRGWERVTERIVITLPRMGETVVTQLSAPMFTYNAADLVRLEHWRNSDGVYFTLSHNMRYTVGPTPWRKSSLWTEHKFNPDPYENKVPNPWWFRYRTIGAPGVMDRVADTLTQIEDHADDPFMIRQFVTELRREITLDALGAPIYREREGS